MSIEAEDDNSEHELSVEEILSMILQELKLLNLRTEEGLETGIEPEDTENDN